MQKVILALALVGATGSLVLASREAVWKAASGVDAASYVARYRQEEVLMYRPEEMAGALIGTFLEDSKVIADVLAARLARTPGGTAADRSVRGSAT